MKGKTGCTYDKGKKAEAGTEQYNNRISLIIYTSTGNTISKNNTNYKPQICLNRHFQTHNLYLYVCVSLK